MFIKDAHVSYLESVS